MIDYRVELALGAAPDAVAPTWTDISGYVRTDDEVGLVRGRSSEGGQITPSTGSLVLDNTPARDGTGRPFDPDNTSSPYSPHLVDRTPIRIRGVFGSTPTLRTVWRGVVEAWPQIDSTDDDVVEIECLDVLGIAAQSDPPPSAWDAHVRALAPDNWWTIGERVWIDSQTGKPGRHHGGPVEFTGADGGERMGYLRPPVNGDESTWGHVDADGWGVLHPDSNFSPSSSQTDLVAAWIQLPRSADRMESIFVGIPQPVTMLMQATTATERFRVTIAYDRVLVVVDDGTFNEGWTWGADFNPIGLFDGKPHHIAIAMGSSTGSPMVSVLEWHIELFIDGVLVPVAATSTQSGTASTPTELRVGHPFSFDAYQGVIDHITIWRDLPDDPWSTAIADMVAQLHDIGRGGWAGQRLDQRVESLADGLGFGGLVGALDTSGIITQQSYRPGNPIDLLQVIEDTEQGRVWVDRQGQIRFSSRGWAWTDTVSTTVQATFSDVASELGPGVHAYLSEGLEIGNDARLVTNVAQVTSENGRMQTVEDQSSIATRGRRNAVHLSGLMHPSDRQSRAIAEWIVYSRSTPTTSVRSLWFVVDTDELADLATSIDEGWLIEVRRRGQIVRGHVAQITHQIGPVWRVGLSLDSSRANRNWFTVDSSPTDDPDHVVSF